ncbi:Hypothetical protein A7982_02820 [Minicystis rosea]|nr:Hypothetical protein A7982_02820 [Minicystis rosea]
MNVLRCVQAPLFALFTSTALLAGCSDGSFGDLPSKPLANEYGPGDRLCKILGPATWVDPTNLTGQGCKQPPDHAVYSTGLTIVAIDTFDETGEGAIGNYWVQDPDPKCAGQPYSGVTVFAPSFSPPDLRLATNDVIDMNGQITEFIGPSGSGFGECRTLPEISGTMSFRYDGKTLPTPVTIAATDLKEYETARQWLGMLVRVENVVITGDPKSSGGRYSAAINVGAGTDIPRITNELYDLEGMGPELKDGTSFNAVTGIVTYFYGFHLVPRSAADFE